MADLPINDLNVASNETLITPDQLKRDIPLSDAALRTVTKGREVIRNILDGTDHRLFVVIGPCSIHDIKAAHEYAERLKALAAEVSDTLYLVMRVYFEKPRTTVGWKGLINDPYLDDSFKIQDGLHIGRQLLLDLAEIGLPTATEALDPISPQYLQDLISWSAIGARTTESQTHREMASGLSSAVGFKNGTDGRPDRGDQRPAIGFQPAPFPGHQPGRWRVDRHHQGQRLRSRGVARRQRQAELRLGQCRALRAGAEQGEGSSRTSWSTAATPTPTRTRPCNRW